MTRSGLGRAALVVLIACCAVSWSDAQPSGGGQQGRQRPPGNTGTGGGEARKRMQQNRSTTQAKTDEQRRQMQLKMQQLRQQRGTQARKARTGGFLPVPTKPDTVSTATLPIQSNTIPSTSDTVTTWTAAQVASSSPGAPSGSAVPASASQAAAAGREGRGPLREVMAGLNPEDGRKMATWLQNMTQEQRQALRQEVSALPADQRGNAILKRAGIDPSRMVAPAVSAGAPAASSSQSAVPAVASSATPTPKPLVIAARGDGQSRFSAAAIDAGASLPRPGDPAPPFRLTTTDGSAVTLDEFRGRNLVVEFGSLTCPVYRGHIQAMKSLRKDAPPNTAFLLVYTTEAHPSGSSSPYSNREWVPEKNTQDNVLKAQTTTLQQRLVHAAELRTRFGETALIAIDGMDDAAWKAYGSRPNSAFLIGPDGRIILAQEWLDPVSLEKALPR